MNDAPRWKKGWFLVLGFCFFSFGSLFANTDVEQLAEQIANAIEQMPGRHYKTIAIARIKKANRHEAINLDELIDYTNVKLVRAKRFRVTDRSKLQLILKEQKVQLSELVTPNEYKELGQLLGVQLFVYGTLYPDSLILKAIDVQNSSIAWADVFPIKPDSIDYLLLYSLGQNLTASLNLEAAPLRNDRITKISFWNLEVPRRFTPPQVMDYMTAAISKSQVFTVIDRENLQMLAQEQKLNQSVFIDESQARQLGQLYGVDAFLYGTLTHKGNHAYIASLKMMNIFTGVIVWADLIKFNLPNTTDQGKNVNPFDEEIKKRRKKIAQPEPEGMVQLPAGTFTMGSDDPLYDATPRRLVRLNAFWLDSHEVTNEQYQQFVKATNHRPPTGWKRGTFPSSMKDFPVVGVSWEDAQLYCQFLKKRLPTEEEWERASRGTQGRRYPWSSPNFSPNFVVTQESGAQGPVSVKDSKKDVTPERIYNLAGNVREYVADVYRPSPGGDATNFSGQERVVRGSSWAHGKYEATGFFRGHTRPNLAWADVGFRCAK